MMKLRLTVTKIAGFVKVCKTNPLPTKFVVGLAASLLLGAAPISGFTISPCSAQPVLSTPQNLGRPVSGKTAVYARNVWDMTVFENKIYIGIGCSSPNSGDTPVITLNPATSAYTTEFVVQEEQIDRYEIVNGSLYIPGHDYTAPPQFSQVYKKTGATWGVLGQIQSMALLFSLVEFGGKLYTSGGNWSGNFSVFASANNGATWQGVGDSRFYRPDGTLIAGNGARHWLLMPLAGQLYSFRYSYINGTPQQFGKLNQTTGQFEPYFLPSSVFAPGITGQVDRFRYRNPLYLSDGSALVQGVVNDDGFGWSPLALYHVTDMVAGGVQPVPVPEGVVFDHVLRGNTIYLCAWNATNKHNIVYALDATNLSAAPREVLRFVAPTFARSFEEVNGDFYFGLGCGLTTVPQTGEIWKVAGQVPNTPPQVALTSPAAGSTFNSPATVTLGATASDTDGTVSKVEFFANDQKIGEDTTAPYTLDWNATGAGIYALKAVATDDDGLSAATIPINVQLVGTLITTADSYVMGSGVSSNYGTRTYLQTKTADVASTRWTYLKFDISAASPTFNTATLRLRGGGGASGGTISSVFAVPDTSWTETGITWTNKPALAATELSHITIPPTASALQNWNVTAYIQSEKAAGRNTVTLAIKNPQTSTSILSFDSKEAVSTGGTAPQLIIN